ncbi:MAG: HAMP domain-containing histidine kinase [Opitutaceae bacterium]|nr:HAMP domain-containing histidine kinase [Opitutaceae bacterium]
MVNRPVSFRSFRWRLMAAMMLVVGLLTFAGLYFAQGKALASAEAEHHREFRAALAALNAAQATRADHLAERCRTLVGNPRIHAALEDDALDLLYISARDELSDLMRPVPADASPRSPVHARFYRFLDANGAVIPPPENHNAGALGPGEEAQLSLPRLPLTTQLGWVKRKEDPLGDEVLVEVIATPIVSTETRRPIAALVVGLAPTPSSASASELTSTGDIRAGLWTGGRLQLPGLEPAARTVLRSALRTLVDREDRQQAPATISLGGRPHLLFCQPLNAGSLYPVAHEFFLYPLDNAVAQQNRLRWQILGAGALFLLGGLGSSHLLAARLSRPVEKMAMDSAVNALQRSRAEAALESTQAELQRSARFSANASHQLKTPVAVLRAGLDELLARQDLPADVRSELEGLVGETTRFTSMIEDLLLLSRVDAGRVRIEFAHLDLVHLVATCLDDFSVLPDPFDLEVVNHLPDTLSISGEKRYVAHILQNLVENARNYNRPRGRIDLSAHTEGAQVILSVGNTGRVIPREHQPHIFDRFHRGATGADLPGHGLGLNLARELARLHGGDVRLAISEDDWTEFEVVLPRHTEPLRG